MSGEERRAREELIEAARAIASLGLSHGSSGNISVRVGERILVTPTGSSLARIGPDDLPEIGADGEHLGGPKPSKEAFLHAAVLRARPDDRAVVHTHSTHAAAVSCLDGLDPDDAISPLTAYFAMKVGRVPLLPYHAPGDEALGPVAARAAAGCAVLLLSNHGPIAAARSLETAIERVEELEETARIMIMLGGRPTRPLGPEQLAALGGPR